MTQITLNFSDVISVIIFNNMVYLSTDANAFFFSREHGSMSTVPHTFMLSASMCQLLTNVTNKVCRSDKFPPNTLDCITLNYNTFHFEIETLKATLLIKYAHF